MLKSNVFYIGNKIKHIKRFDLGWVIFARFFILAYNNSILYIKGYCMLFELENTKDLGAQPSVSIYIMKLYATTILGRRYGLENIYK